MLFDNEEIQRDLRSIIFKVTHDDQTTAELFYDTLAHLWAIEVEHPGQTRSWYFQNCRAFARDHVKAGKSIDSQKRRGNSTTLSPDIFTKEDTFADVSAKDMLAVLTTRLEAIEQEILRHFILGETEAQVAGICGISQQAVSKRRKRISARMRALLLDQK